MHNYLRSIGFSELNKTRDIEKIIAEVQSSFDDKKVTEDADGRLLGEMLKDFGPDVGIAVCGEYDDENQFHTEYYFPYFRGSNISAQADVTLERHSGKESYAGAFEDPRVGVTLIFYLQNTGEYLNLLGKGMMRNQPLAVMLSAIARSGTILLPIKKDQGLVEKEKANTKARNQMITAARNGDEEAMESLTMEDIDTYSMISRRIAHEDVFTIVDTYFMPYGLECDQYHIMGDISSYEYVTNRVTGEELCQMEVTCNDMRLDVCINKKDLVGEPEVGRRFRGIVWLQGYVSF